MRGYGREGLFLIGLSIAAGGGTATPALAQSTQALDPITVVATKTEEKAIESLAAVSVRRQEDFDQLMPARPSELFFGVPGVSFQERGDDPASAINIRGLQDFGRVAVILDGARQNFQKSGHNANGAFYLEPELLSGVDIVRGPVANIYGSGAIGGVVSFQTKDVNDILRPGERWGILGHGMIGSNQGKGLLSAFAAGRPTDNIDIFAGAVYRSHSAFEAGTNGGPIAGIAANVGPGATVPNSGYDVATGIAKITVRPADGHEIKVGGITLKADYLTGQPGSSNYSTTVHNDLLTARWKYARPDDNLFDWDANVYWTQTKQDQVKISGATSSSTGAVGDPRNFNIETIGTDIHNTSRFVLGNSRHAITLGVDAFQDKVKVFDPGGVNDLFTPSGKREVYGAFAQWKANYSDWVEVIGALRYDAYNLNGSGATAFNSSGDRLSPKITVGLTPVAGITPYVTYAEGYRAPAVTEVLNAGVHPPFFPGSPNGFTFLPNTSLRPEVGKTKEAGINFKFDDIAFAGDKFRGKVNVYRNDVDDYIDLATFGPPILFCPVGPIPGCPPVPMVPLVPYSFTQYQNVANARLEGIEAETMYDAGAWFLGVSASHVRGTNRSNGQPLFNIPPDQIATTVGVRLLERKLTLSVRWAAVAAKKAGDIPDLDGDGLPDVPAMPSYNLVNLYVGYQPTEDILAGLSVENLFNRYYVRYPEVFPQAGITVKGSLKIRFGA
jgi:hemoglobin/transferrin/lactoferrin receptor protein